MASSQPPPRAKPLTAAAIGFGDAAIRLKMSCPLAERACPSSRVSPWNSEMSAPATKALSGAGDDGAADILVVIDLGDDFTEFGHDVLVEAFSLSGRWIVTVRMLSVRSVSKVLYISTCVFLIDLWRGMAGKLMAQPFPQAGPGYNGSAEPFLRCPAKRRCQRRRGRICHPPA
jgi:hypothetical protein